MPVLFSGMQHNLMVKQTKKQAVVTGIGVVSALGTGREAFWQNCRQGISGIKPVAGVLEGEFSGPLAGLVTDYDPRQYLKPAVYRRMSRLSRMAVSASVEAVQDSALDLERTDPERVAIVTGTAYGSSASVEDFFTSYLEEGPRGAKPMHFPETVPNAPAGNISIVLGITGANTTFGQNDISAESALIFAQGLLRHDRADAVIVCGFDEITPMIFGCYDDIKALNPGLKLNDGRIAPKTGAGIVLGEGAGALVMELKDKALERKARCYGVFESGCLVGAITAPGSYLNCEHALDTAIGQALEKAELCPDQIRQICVSANFSGDLEQVEARALSRIQGDTSGALMVTPLRYLAGSFGGAGILSAAAVCLGFYHNCALPAVELAQLAQASQPIRWSHGGENKAENALLTACTHGGGCAALVFSACKKDGQGRS
ncbi:MAG: hypothetical protein GY874_20520 [Desulfobacteraceae bacterium]|nr:hypothetical protein [Desulfobacteraceae bacterium]